MYRSGHVEYMLPVRIQTKISKKRKMFIVSGVQKKDEVVYVCLCSQA